MTARELIIKLQQFEPDTEVWLPCDDEKRDTDLRRD